MAASFVSLGYDCVGPDPLRLLCLSQSRCTGKPCDSMILQLCDKWRGIQTHDRRNNGGSDGDQGVALLLKIGQPDSADLVWNWGPQLERNSRTRCSAAKSREGARSGI